MYFYLENLVAAHPTATGAFQHGDDMSENGIKFSTFGRTPIFTCVTKITRDNVIDVLRKAIPIFEKNARECEYLYNYYKGDQPILMREKEVRPEICNTIVVNRAYEIVTFKTGRFLYKNIQYVNRGDNNIDEINALNSFMYADGKNGKDRTLVDWMHICGHGYRMAKDAKKEEGTPFHTYTIDPRRAFVVYADTVEQEPVLGVYYTDVLDADGNKIKTYTCYSDTEVFTVQNYEIKESVYHLLGGVPIVEYPANYARLGCFEVVLELLDAINLAESNRLDGIEQFIQALMVIKNMNMNAEDITFMKQVGAVCIPSESDIEYLTQELNQSQTQTLVDDMYQAVLTICGMPNRNGGSSTSDNKGAVVLRDGWSAAATAVKETKQYFEASERCMLKMVLKVFNIYRDAETKSRNELALSDIDVHFDEGEYENTLEKAQVLTMLLSNDWVHPKNAYEFSNITSDPEAAYIAGREFHEQQMKLEEDQLNVGNSNIEETYVQGHWRAEHG